ncbi:hypothetical protein VTJ83DRAFT_1150 [Remersonia thermophila]|uniref:Uncharacterized protein n=1 Tax=Remersonia thermophila TaxID=72144 RepID=A0ABR4DN89_9PEZI
MSLSQMPVGKFVWENQSRDPPKHGSFLVLPNQQVLVGRDEERNDVAFTDPVVSRCQLEIFSIVVDEQCSHPPLVFVRDRGSANGTAVNDKIIGKGVGLSPSRLLQHGDIITIGRYTHLKLVYTQLLHSPCRYALTPFQRQEVELFRDRYVVTEQTIGDGGHAVVFLATEVATGQHVVCKVHDTSRYAPASKKVQRIRQEAALLSTLDHPNILPIKAAFETPQTIYVITELATGGDLFSILLRYDQLDELQIRAIIRQVLRAVAYIHSKGVAHRDIKPENILCGITPCVPYRIMLSDFGDSGISADSGPERLKSAVGTKFYRPPECHGPDPSHDLSVDIWAVGMLALQLLLGYEELPGLSTVVFCNQEEIDAYLDMVFANLHSPASDAAGSFVRGCLTFDSAQRPSARQAFCHRWLQEPESDRKVFERLEQDGMALWRPQKVKFPVIEMIGPVGVEPGQEGGGGRHERAHEMRGTASGYLAAKDHHSRAKVGARAFLGASSAPSGPTSAAGGEERVGM